VGTGNHETAFKFKNKMLDSPSQQLEVRVESLVTVDGPGVFNKFTIQVRDRPPTRRTSAGYNPPRARFKFALSRVVPTQTLEVIMILVGIKLPQAVTVTSPGPPTRTRSPTVHTTRDSDTS
jgi:hypothetical protein